MNNEPDYKDNLVFEPKMTWEEFCQYVKENVICEETDIAVRVSFWAGSLVFYKNGKIKDTEGYKLAEDRTYEQMKTIFEALRR